MCDELDAWLGSELCAKVRSPESNDMVAARRAISAVMRTRKSVKQPGVDSGGGGRSFSGILDFDSAGSSMAGSSFAAMLDMAQKGGDKEKQVVSETERAAEEQAMCKVVSDEASLRKLARWREMAALQKYDEMRSEIIVDKDADLRRLATMASALEGSAGALQKFGPSVKALATIRDGIAECAAEQCVAGGQRKTPELVQQMHRMRKGKLVDVQPAVLIGFKDVASADRGSPLDFLNWKHF